VALFYSGQTTPSQPTSVNGASPFPEQLFHTVNSC
jgi:hypothetical protein